MNIELKHLKFATFFLIILYGLGCSLSTNLSPKTISNNRLEDYSLFYNNRSAHHKPHMIYVIVGTVDRRHSDLSFYHFYFHTDTVLKIYNNRVSILATESTKSNFKQIIPSITEFETEIFDKVIYYSDSLKLKDFKFLKKATGFEETSLKVKAIRNIKARTLAESLR